MNGFLFRLIPPRTTFASDMTAEERETMMLHVSYWTSLAQQGKALAFGPVHDPDGPYGSHGIAIVLAENLEEAGALGDADPAVRSPHGFRTTIAPMLALVTPDGSYPAPSVRGAA
jgi:uncharacterized protein